MTAHIIIAITVLYVAVFFLLAEYLRQIKLIRALHAGLRATNTVQMNMLQRETKFMLANTQHKATA